MWRRESNQISETLCKVSIRVPCFVWREEGDPSQMRVKSLGVVDIIEDYTVR
jgi:hypothetical protein